MKKINYIMAALVMILSCTAHANEQRGRVKEMLKQVADVNSSWKPIVGQNIYVLRNFTIPSTIYIMLFYDSNKYTADGPDPEKDDMRAVFLARGTHVELLYIDFFAGKELLIKNIDTLVPTPLPPK